LAAVSRFLIDLRVGARTLAQAKELVASVAVCSAPGEEPLLLIDDHLPYPSAILEVFGVVRHRRRRRPRGRKRQPDLKPPPGLLVGVVQKVRDAHGHLVRVKVRALFGRLKEIRRRLAKLGIGREVNTSHLERLNGTLRGQQARLARRTRDVSRGQQWLQWSVWLWRDVYNWVHPHESLNGRTPAQALGLAGEVWSVQDYIWYPVHVSDLQREDWGQRREKALTSALNSKKREKSVPTS
jgi:hypothetical protein